MHNFSSSIAGYLPLRFYKIAAKYMAMLYQWDNKVEEK